MGIPRVLRVTLIAAMGAVVAYFSFLTWSFHYGIEAEQTTFSSVAWKEKANELSHSNDPGCIRGGMALDIVSTNLLNGKLFAEVISLLGEPDGKMESTASYQLGQCSGLGWHNSVLQVRLGEKRQVISAVILRQ